MFTYLNIKFCSLLISNRLQDFLLLCPFKHLTGIDCPGCGFQRALIALFQGDFKKSFLIYPPTIPLLIISAWWLADSIFKIEGTKHTIKKSMFITVAAIVLINYILKMSGLYIAYTASV
jgi:hypothetical protein